MGKYLFTVKCLIIYSFINKFNKRISRKEVIEVLFTLNYLHYLFILFNIGTATAYTIVYLCEVLYSFEFGFLYYFYLGI
jgi:hypothetical protein